MGQEARDAGDGPRAGRRLAPPPRVALGGHAPGGARGTLPRTGRRRRARGGIPDVVSDDETGLLVDPDRPEEIADALVRILSDRELAERLGVGGLARSAEWTYTADEYADRVVELVGSAVEASRR